MKRKAWADDGALASRCVAPEYLSREMDKNASLRVTGHSVARYPTSHEIPKFLGFYTAGVDGGSRTPVICQEGSRIGIDYAK